MSVHTVLIWVRGSPVSGEIIGCHLPCLCAGGSGFRPARVSWGRVSRAASRCLSPLSCLAWNSSVLGELSRGREQSRRSWHRADIKTSSLTLSRGPQTRTITTKLNLSRNWLPSDISGDHVSVHSPVTDPIVASGGRKAEKSIASRFPRSTWLW